MDQPTVEFCSLVRQMRLAQKRYFRDRTQQSLNESKDLERRVDRSLDEMESVPDLFQKE